MSAQLNIAMIEPAYEYRARLMTREELDPIYDADTLWLTVDLGFNLKWDIGPCRLMGINAPEMRGADRPKGIISRDYVREVLARPENKHFLIRTEKDEKEKYGRYLVTIILADGTNLNDDLVEKGLAQRATY